MGMFSRPAMPEWIDRHERLKAAEPHPLADPRDEVAPSYATKLPHGGPSYGRQSSDDLLDGAAALGLGITIGGMFD